jgi:hypothetical protein
LGCRNISTLLLPVGFKIDRLFESTSSYSHYINHNKYRNNLDYNSALLLMQQIPFLTNNLLILRELRELGSPVSILNIIYYHHISEVDHFLLENMAGIQCMVSAKDYAGLPHVNFGMSQQPALDDFADNINTMEFLIGI